MIPTSIQAGITAEWSYPLPSHLTESTFEYILQGPAKVTIPTTVVGGDIEVKVAATTTTNWQAGNYQYQLIATNGSDKHLVDSGALTIAPNFADLPAGHDFRSHAQIMLDAINQVLEGRITKDVESYEIDNRKITRIPILELHKLKRTYSLQVQREKRKQAGKPNFQPRKVKTRFST